MKEPLVASRGEESLVRDLAREPRDVTRARQQQEILRDLLDDLGTVNATWERSTPRCATSCATVRNSTSTCSNAACATRSMNRASKALH